MNKTSSSRALAKLSLAACLAAGAAPANGAVLQTFAGPFNITGGGLGTTLVDTNTDTNDWIDGYTGDNSTTPLYYQFTVTVTNNAGESGGGGMFGGFQLYEETAERFAVGNNWGSVSWSTFFPDQELNGVAGTGGAKPIVIDEMVTFAVKIDQVADSATVWLNPNFGLSEAAQDTGLTTVYTSMGLNNAFNTIRLRAGNDAAAMTFADIVIRTDSPFVPEPGISALAALAGVVMLRRRRR